MAVAMVQIGIVRMPVSQGGMPVLMSMRLPPIPCSGVRMLMVLVVHVLVAVDKGLVNMLVLVALADVQPDAERHEAGGNPEENGRLLVHQHQGECGAEERGDGKVSACARRSEVPQRHDE